MKQSTRFSLSFRFENNRLKQSRGNLPTEPKKTEKKQTVTQDSGFNSEAKEKLQELTAELDNMIGLAS